jgi:hypothetical protein
MKQHRKGMQGVRIGKPKRVPLPKPDVTGGISKPSDHGPRTRHNVPRKKVNRNYAD